MDPLLYGFKITREHCAQIIYLSGEIDYAASLDICPRLSRIIEECAHMLLFDLNEVTFLDSEGLKMLIGAFRQAQTRHLKAQITGCNLQVLRVINLAGVEDILLMADDDTVEFSANHNKAGVVIQ